MAQIFTRTLASLLLGSALACLTVSAGAQEALAKAESLVRVQSIPMSRLMTFEQAYPVEFLDYIGWLTLRSLDTSSSWSPKNRGWNLYRLNLRIDLEEKLRNRWQAAGGTIRSLSQTPDTSLAKYYADSISPVELDEALEFYQSAAGKKFLSYQNELRRAYYRGKLVFEQLRFDPTLGALNQSGVDLRRSWLAQNKLPPESTTEAYAFHAQVLQRIFPALPATELIFDLAAGALPGTPAMDRLNNALNASERDAVRKFLASGVATKELPAIKLWHESIAKTLDLLPLLIGDIRSLLELTVSWKRTRADPEALPRSIARMDSASIKVPDALTLTRLEEAGPIQLKQCLPSLADSSIAAMEKFIQTKGYRTSSQTYYATATASIFITRNEYGACVATTPPGYPVLGVDSFVNSVYVNGMTDSQTQEWFRKIAQDIAVDGSSESLVIMPNGNAFEVAYAINARSPAELLYMIRFMQAGTFKPENYHIVEIAPGFKSISSTTTSGSNGVQRASKSIISTPDDLKRDAASRKRNSQ